MTQQRETLTDLVAAAVGPDGRWTYQAFQARAVDPETGYRPSTGLIQKIKEGSLVKINPELVRAIAAGLGKSSREVGLAAFHQYIGTPLESRDPFPGEHLGDTTVTVTAVPGATAEDMPLTLGHLKRILAEIEERDSGGDESRS
jgi:hypothetical protein